MLIGVDFDNTIVCYDQVFHKVALERGVIPSDLDVSKDSVRGYLRSCDKEDVWTEMQGYVYGVRINEAAAFDGVADFFAACRDDGVGVCIISHKTLYPYAGEQYDLHQAAYGWMEAKGFFAPHNLGLKREQVFLELTKREKLERIGALGCTHFIDDLPEFLSEPEFPKDVIRVLFDPNNKYPTGHTFPRANSWADLHDMIFGRKHGPR